MPCIELRKRNDSRHRSAATLTLGIALACAKAGCRLSPVGVAHPPRRIAPKADANSQPSFILDLQRKFDYRRRKSVIFLVLWANLFERAEIEHKSTQYP